MIVANILQPLIDAADWVITFFHDDVGLSWGFSIVALTFATRLVILPLSVSQIRSMRALQAYAPQIKQLQERYKDDKQRQQRELIAFYQENKINPLASCIPLMLQLPVFLALYQLLNGQTFKDEMLAQPPVSFFFIDNLTEKADGRRAGRADHPLHRHPARRERGDGRPGRGHPADHHVRAAVRVRPVRHHVPGRARRLLDLDQRLDARPAARRQVLLPAAADPDGRRRSRRRSRRPPPPRKKKKRR